MFYKTQHILNDLDDCIDKENCFSCIRYGDGTLKALHAFYFNDEEQINAIVEKEGIPRDKWPEIMEYWKQTANTANYIDTCDVYINGTFWPRVRKNNQPMSEKTRWKINNWKLIYDAAGFTNTNYCNPELNFLSCLDFIENPLTDILECKNICMITAHRKYLQPVLPTTWFIDYYDIVDFGGDHYNNCFKDICNKIENEASKYDVYLVAAGELGRYYSGLIKKNGGRALDIGSLADYWAYGNIPVRLQPYLKRIQNNRLKLTLTEEGKRYSDNI